MFGIIPKPLWSKKIQPDDLNRILMALRIVLIQTKNRNILIDTGVGDYHPEKFVHQFEIQSTPSPISTILKEELGLKAEDITDIILTHLHFDHVGGLGTGANGTSPIFPNATLHINKNHYDYALSPTLRDSGSFQDHYFKPLINSYMEKGQVNFLTDNDGIIIEDEGEIITYKTSFGHTPYMIHPIFDNYIYMADLVPMSHHIKLPWVMGYDIEPGTTTIYKKRFYDHIIKNNLSMIFEHDIDIFGGPLEINERGQYQLKESHPSSGELTQILI